MQLDQVARAGLATDPPCDVARACCSCWASARSCCRAARQLITPHAGDCRREKRWGASSVYRTSPGKSAGSLRCALRSAETTRSTGGDRPPRRRGAQYRLSAQSDCRATRRPVAMVGLLATFVSALACGVAAASITLFEAPLFHLGSVNGQSGVGGFPWKSAPLGAIPACVPTPTNGKYDQEVVANGLPASVGFGVQSLRMSNACGSAEFFNQTYSRARQPSRRTCRQHREGGDRAGTCWGRTCGAGRPGPA